MSSTSSHPRTSQAAALDTAAQAQRPSVKKGVSFFVSTAPERSARLSSNRGSARSGKSRRGSAAAAPDKRERRCWSFLTICRFMVRLRRFSVLKDAPVAPEERHKYWRALHASSHQKKLCRRGGFLGANKGTFQPRALVLHSKSLAYQHEDGTRVRSIGFADVVKVQRLKAQRQPARVCRGVATPAAGPSAQRFGWIIRLRDGNDLTFQCMSEEHRDAWVLCVRNNLHAWARQRWLSSVLCCECHGVLSRQKAPALRRSSSVRSMVTLARLSEGNHCCDHPECDLGPCHCGHLEGDSDGPRRCAGDGLAGFPPDDDQGDEQAGWADRVDAAPKQPRRTRVSSAHALAVARV